MRRRIYDAWNVLKAASIIVPRDLSEKYFMFNRKLGIGEQLTAVKDDDDDGGQSSSCAKNNN